MKFIASSRTLWKRSKGNADSTMPVVKNKPFAFPVHNSHDPTKMPTWAHELKREVGELRSRMNSAELS